MLTNNKKLLDKYFKDEPKPVVAEVEVKKPVVVDEKWQQLTLHLLDLERRLQELSTPNKVDVVATVKRDKNGKMTEILITNKKTTN